MAMHRLFLGLLSIVVWAALGWGQTPAKQAAKTEPGTAFASPAEEQWTIRMTVSGNPAVALRRWLNRFFAEAQRPSGSQPLAAEGMPGEPPEPPDCGPKHGKYIVCLGPDGASGGGYGGEYITDCMQTQSALGGCGDNATCW